MRWLKLISLSVCLIITALVLFVCLQGIQYTAAYSGKGFARALPTLEAYAAKSGGICTSGPLTVLTFNVEYGSEFIESMAANFRGGDTGGALPWSTRLPEIRARIASYAPDLIGLQETHTDTDIATIVSNSHYTLVSYHLGHFHYGDAALLFKTQKFELLDSGQVWLGPNPKLPMSFGYRPLSVIRYINWAMLREKANGFTFMFVNTHFDNAGKNKEPSATLFREQLSPLAQGIPMIVTGDFNTKADSERYRRMVGADKPMPWLQNTYLHAEKRPVEAEFHPDKRIDHILVGGPCAVKAEEWSLDPRPLENGQRLSDHDPIWARLRFSKKGS